MSRTLKFWFALLFIFAGLMTLLFASGKIGSSNNGGQGEATAMTVVDNDAQADSSHHEVNDDQFSGADGEGSAAEFTFTDQKGKKFSSSSLDGKIWVGSVFFATCPSTCRIQNTRVAELQKDFGDKGVEFVSITCDPDKDTPSALNDYSKMFGAEADKWHFLTGDFELAKKIGEQKFMITVLPQTHSDRLILFGKDGTRVGRYRSLDPDQFKELKSEIEKLLSAEDTTEPAEEPAATDAAEPDEPESAPEE